MFCRINTAKHCLLLALLLVGSLATVSASIETQYKVVNLDPETTVAPYITCLNSHDVTLVSAHRGGPLPGLPENALESMQKTILHGPVLLEIDVRETSDGVLVLLHDKSLERTTNAKGLLSEFTWEQLKTVKLKDNAGNLTDFSIPRLKDVLMWADDKAILQLDVKRGVDYKKVAKTVIEAGAVDSVLIIAYRKEDALDALAVNKNFSFSISINELSDLANLLEDGIPRQQIVAWTGVVKNMSKDIWSELEINNIPIAAGAFWDIESQIIESGNTEPYLVLAQNEVDIIGSDHYNLAFDTLSKRQNINYAINKCKGS